MTDLLPLAIVLGLLMPLLHSNVSNPLVQLYLVIIVSYLNLFPAVDQFLSFQPAAGFLEAQFIAVLLFEVPLFFFLTMQKRSAKGRVIPLEEGQRLKSNSPILLLILLSIFYFISFKYNLFFVRLGYEAFLNNPDAVPGFFLYPYRLVVEASFFIILYLSFSIRLSRPDSRNRLLYKFTLWLYLFTFLTFFFVNSRMQFLLLIASLYFIRPSFFVPKFRLQKYFLLFLLAIFLVVSLTIIRELYIEKNNRVDVSSLLDLFGSVGSLIAGRLNSLVMLSRSIEAGYNPYGFEMSGLLHVWNMYVSFFTDPVTYAQIRASEITSPSVVIVNQILNENHVDFPKSMILDIQLTFGALSLPFLAWILAIFINFIQIKINSSKYISIPLLFALYMAPMQLQFEKETVGLISFAFKWSPILLILIIMHKIKYKYRPILSIFHRSLSLKKTSSE